MVLPNYFVGYNELKNRYSLPQEEHSGYVIERYFCKRVT